LPNGAADLARRRRLALNFAWWYLAPMAAGVTLMVMGPMIQAGALGLAARVALLMAVIALVLVLIQRSAGAQGAAPHTSNSRCWKNRRPSNLSSLPTVA
jgi:hypothetical protein